MVRRDGQCVNVKDSQYYNGNFIILGACENAQRNQLWTFKSNGTIRSNGKCLTSGYGGWGAYIMIANGANARVWLANRVFGTEPRQQWALYDDIPREELLQAFPSTDYTHSRLGFSGNYGSLPDRDRIELGHGALNYAIINLYYCRSQPSALLVIIQMVAQAVRIRYIEHLILRNMYANLNFIPDSRAISLENIWSDLSQQIQWSCESGVFCREIQVRIALNTVVPIRNVEDSMSLAALALNNCPDGEPTTNIVERDGQCVNVKDSQYYNGNFIILGACGNAQCNQLWTFKSDGTIRSN
nr:lectin precursor [Tanacetum cinerariifolium]